MYAAVIPCLKLPRQMTGEFDYAVPAELAAEVGPGSVVMIPWRGRPVPGVVVALRKTPGVDAKRVRPITRLCAPERMPADLLAAIAWMAERYAAAPATVVQCFLPAVPKRKQTAETLTARNAAGGAFAGRVIRCATPSAKMEETVAAASAALAERRGAIVIVPHHDDIAAAVTALREALVEHDVVEFHGDLAMTALWNSWRRAASGDPVVVVGTRMAVGAPVASLGAIVIQECDSQDLKQYDQNPRYDARAVARKRAEAAGARLTLIAHAPRAEELALTVREGFIWQERSSPQAADITVAEFPKGARSAEERLLTPTALDAAAEALRSGKRVLLFHNRRGDASALLCRDCGRLERCPSCDIPLRVHADSLHCHRCGSKKRAPLVCPACASPSFRTYGLGTGAVTPILSAAFPDAKIAQMDADSRDTDLTVADIMVGTQLLLHAVSESPHAPAFGAVIATSLDALLGHPGFRATENAWRTVRTLTDVAAASGCPLILQTFDGENAEVRRLLEEPLPFLKEELASRDAAGFPPKAELATVTAVAPSEEEARAKITRLAASLKTVAGQASVSGPLRPSNPFRHGTWRSLLVVRGRTLPKALVKALADLPEDHIIDRDPEYLG